MTPKLVEERWSEELIKAIRLDSSDLRIICPFIKAGPLERLLRHRTGKGEIKVITRFNFADCAEGVSDVVALRRLLDAGASVRGVRNLHAKLYVFGKSRAIITSCNLTDAALSRNHELGLVVDDEEVVDGCLHYFRKLWERAKKDLRPERVTEWEEQVRACQVGGRPNAVRDLGDFGTDVDLDPAPTPQAPDPLAQAPQAFVKFMGTAGFLVPTSTPVLEEIERSGCHREACYPSRRRPRSVRDGATIFMGRLTDEPDIWIFGRATGMAYVPGRDDAKPAEIKRRSWRKDWSRYIRCATPSSLPEPWRTASP